MVLAVKKASVAQAAEGRISDVGKQNAAYLLALRNYTRYQTTVETMIKDGGPAFPQTATPTDGFSFCGMSMRDYFAAAALQGLLAGYTSSGSNVYKKDGEDIRIVPLRKAAPELAYDYADAMLKEREK